MLHCLILFIENMQEQHNCLALVLLTSSFRRSLVANIVVSVAFINLNEDLDPFVWGLHKDGIAIVKSML